MTELILIEENENIGLLLNNNLKQFGFNVTWFKNIQDVKPVKAEVKSVLIIFDIDNSNENNLKNILDKLNVTKFKIITISNRGDFDTRLQAVRYNSSSFIKKPININELIEEVYENIDSLNLNPYKVLMIDDQKSILEYYSRLLVSHGFVFNGIDNPKFIIDTLDDFMPDAFIVDYNMPECSGEELSILIRQISKYKSAPVVIVTSEDIEKLKSEMSINNVDEFFKKDINMDCFIKQLRDRIRRSIRLAKMMALDSLTQLKNHGSIIESATQQFSLALRNRTPCSLVMLDIDNFKSINDTYGHRVGDKVLISLSQIIQIRLRKSDSVGRYGGEEFLIVMPDTEKNVAKDIIQDILEQFSKIKYSEKGNSFTVTFSAGVCSSIEFNNFGDALEAADKTMYIAKKSGKNKILTCLI